MKEPIRILIHIEGGCVTGVACSLADPDAVEVMIVDEDDRSTGESVRSEEEIEAFEALCPTWIA